MRLAFSLGFAVPLAVVAGCSSCGKEKPYTPFGVVSAQASASVAEEDAGLAEEEDAGPKSAFSPRPSLAAAAGATHWTLDGRTLDAPQGRIFERALVADFDADQKNEIVAWTLRAADAPNQASPGELWLYPHDGAAKKLAELPGFVPTGPACKHNSALTQTGPKSVTLDVSAACSAGFLPRAPTRAIVVVSPLGERPVLVSVRVADAAPGESLKLAIDSSDRDADGRDDAMLSISVGAEKSERPATAALIWLDRTAGTSRDASEPGASLARLSATDVALSKRKKLGQSVRSGVANARRLLATLCAEGGVPRIFEVDGAAFKCAPLAGTVDRLLDAEVHAALTDGDVQGAYAARARDGWYFGAASDKEKKSLDKALLAAVTPIEAPKLLGPSAKPTPRGKSPRYSPLAFESGGALLIQTSRDLVRVDQSGHEETLGEGGTSWPVEIARPDGARVSQAFVPCDRNDVAIAFTAAGTAPPPVYTTLVAPRPGTCAGGPGIALSLDPLGFKNDTIDALIAGEPVGARSSKAEAVLRPRVMGTPRSPDGRLTVTVTPLGVLVSGGDKPELWKVDSATLAECAVADADAAIACMDGSTVKLWQRP